MGSPPLGPLKDCWGGQSWFSRTCDSIMSGRVLTKIAVRARVCVSIKQEKVESGNTWKSGNRHTHTLQSFCQHAGDCA